MSNSHFLLAMLAGGIISLPAGPFGIWAIHVLVRERGDDLWDIAGWLRGLWSIFIIALGGVLGDIAAVGAYYLMIRGAGMLSATAESFIYAFFSNGFVHGIGLIAVGFFLNKAAQYEDEGRVFVVGRFWSPFLGTFTVYNLFLIGIVFSTLGLTPENVGKNVDHVFAGIFAGGMLIWVAGVVVFSLIRTLRNYLALLLHFFGRLCKYVGVGYIVAHLIMMPFS